MTLHAVNHSIGLVVTDHDPGHGEFAFQVGVDGEVTELGGWGFSGPPLDTGHFVNAPPNPFAVHSVLVDGDNAEVFQGVRKLIDQHLERFGEVRVWVSTGTSREVTAWVAAGCPETGEAPSDDELREMNRTEVPRADDSFHDASPPQSDEVSYADTEEEKAALAREKVAAARATHRTKQRARLREQCDEAGVEYDKRWGAEKLREALEAAGVGVQKEAARAGT